MPQNERIEIEYKILERVEHEDMPIGAVTLHEMLQDLGFSLSVTAVGRLLRSYRKNGFLERVKNQGHVLTELGKEHIKELASEKALQSAMQDLIGTESESDAEKILGILTARRAIEVEAAYRAALNATEYDIAKMDAVIKKQYTVMEIGEDYSDESASFHRAVLEAANVPMLVTLYNFIGLSNQWQNFFIGTFKLYNTPMNLAHEEIFNAIKDGDPAASSKFMADHMDNVIENAEKILLKRNSLAAPKD